MNILDWYFLSFSGVQKSMLASRRFCTRETVCRSLVLFDKSLYLVNMDRLSIGPRPSTQYLMSELSTVIINH